MGKPATYEPEQGYRYQILTKSKTARAYEHLDYARNRQELEYLIGEYRLAFTNGDHIFKTIKLPMKFWNETGGSHD